MADERIVVTDGGGSGAGVAIGVILGIVILLAVLFFTGVFDRMFGNRSMDVDVNIDTPKPGVVLRLASF